MINSLYLHSERSIQIMAKLRRNPQLEVRVKADAYLPYGEIVQLLELLQEAGIEKIHLDKIGLLTKQPSSLKEEK